ncbi:sensor histidine kinase [Streptomyces humicola]|nr:ATP-binding protein [Streptomyces humicola]
MLPVGAHDKTAPVGGQAWRDPGTPSYSLENRAVQHRMVLLAVLPAGVIAIAGTSALIAVYAAGAARVDMHAAGALLAATLLLVCATLVGAGFYSSAQARAISGRYAELSGLAARGQAELAELRRQITDGRLPQPRQRESLPQAAHDALDRLGHEIEALDRAAEEAVLELAAQARPSEQFEVFANLAHRLESLVHREIGQLDDLENEVEDPDLLRGLFQVDHLATRMRRYAENLSVLGGAVSHRQWTRPVSISDVLRSAVAEIDQYSRVKLVPPIEGMVAGHAVVDVVHLVAELVENATVFSPPHTVVLLRVQPVTAGLAIEVEDRGLGLGPTERNQLNAMLASPDGIALGELLRDGRIGLYVVSALARRHGIVVQLEGNIYGGTQAVLVLPNELLGQQPDPADSARQPSSATAPGPQGHADIAASPRYGPGTHTAPESKTPADEPPRPSGTAPAPQIAAPEGMRPALPTRRRQEHLVPELRQPSDSAGAPEEIEHDPGLIAAFQAGFRLAEDAGDN